MKRFLTALIVAVMMIGMLAAPAMAADEPEPRAWCEVTDDPHSLLSTTAPR